MNNKKLISKRKKIHSKKDITTNKPETSENTLTSFNDKHKGLLVLISCMAFFVIGLIYYYNSIRESSYKNAGLLFIIMAFILTELLIILFFYIRSKAFSLEKAGIFTLAILGTLYMMVFTPSSIPDEETHFKAAYKYSNYITFNFDDTSETLNMRKCDYEVMENSSTKLSYEQYQTVFHNFKFFADKSDTEKIQYETTTITNRPIAYIPAGLGIATARFLHLGGYPAYYMGRFFNLAFYLIFMYLALKKLPIGKIALIIGGMLPMMLHITASYSYDVFSIALCLYLTAYIIDCIFSPDRKVTIKEIIIITVLSCLAIPYKIVYAGIPCLIFLIPKRKFQDKKIDLQKFQLILKFLIIIFTVVSIFIIQITSISKISGEGGSIAKDTYTLSMLTKDLMGTFGMFFRSFEFNGTFYINSFLGFSLGWFQINVPVYTMYAFMFILLAAFMRKEGEPAPIKTFPKLFLIAMFLGMSLLILLSIILDYTPTNVNYAYGVQGRYWLPLLLFIMLIFRNSWITLSKNADKYLLFAAGFLNMWVLQKYLVEILKV